MSNRTMLEINHDFTPQTQELQEWALAMQRYLGSGKWFGTRHHTQPCLLEKPPTGE